MDRRAGQPLHRRPRKFLEGLRDELIAALVAVARHRLRLAERQPDGTTLRDHLEALEERTGRRHPLLDGPAPPAAGRHVWGWFLDLGGGPRPLSHAEIAAWAALTGNRPRDWEVRALRALDAACREDRRRTDGR
ncbi:MAG: hypothetical protein H3C38_17115 [Rhodospirillales bacterium]|nr:hypothetical protein [Rhodospirillales bacterium]